MTKKILVTGGAGFIGSFLVDALVERGHEVRIFDNLEPQVHGPGGKKPDYLNPEAEFVPGDILDRDKFAEALRDVEVVFHEAAAVGVGQSMYQVAKYVQTNSLGTANLLDIIAAGESGKLEKMIVPSSMSIYGEGAYACGNCGPVHPADRTPEMLRDKQWDPICPSCGTPLIPKPVSEDKPLAPANVYAITKRDQEELALSVGKAYGVSTFALRFFSAYGPRQALDNPYTGVAAIFCGNFLRGRQPLIFEDGLQLRDFVHVSDVVRANLACMETSEVQYGCYNVGSGEPTSILGLARLLQKGLGSRVEPVVTNKYRTGDTRNCYADISRIKKEIGFEPKIELSDGITDLIHWVAGQTPKEEIGDAMKELLEKDLAR